MLGCYNMKNNSPWIQNNVGHTIIQSHLEREILLYASKAEKIVPNSRLKKARLFLHPVRKTGITRVLTLKYWTTRHRLLYGWLEKI